jgi:hypothetical protein
MLWLRLPGSFLLLQPYFSGNAFFGNQRQLLVGKNRVDRYGF